MNTESQILSKSPETRPAPEDRQTIILLGASNLTLGWKPVLNAIRGTVPGPLDVRVSLGMGRSYVDWSSFWFRRLPGIADCGLWKSLPEGGSRPPLVLVTDLGNDIVYNHGPNKIFETAASCIRRIQDWRSDARIVMTGLPLDSIKSMDRIRFLIARTILFPTCRMSFTEICEKSQTLDQMIRQFAEQNSFPLVIPRAEWYRVDPIHVIPSLREKVFRHIFLHWNVDTPATLTPEYFADARLPASALRTVAGISRQAQQPVFESPDLIVSAW